MCYFANGKKDQINGNQVTTDRTQAIDNLKAAIVMNSFMLPKSARSIPEFYAHMTASTRLFKEDANGGEGGFFWVEGSRPDHFLLSSVYLLAATRILTMA